MKYLILGASAAGLNAAKTLRKLDESAIITVVSQNTMIYSKSLLHLFITGERNLHALSFVEPDFFEQNDINWVNGVSAVGVNTYRKEVNLSNNLIETYDKLLIATGSTSLFPPNLDYIQDAKNVYSLENLTDAILIRDKISKSKSITFIGGGLVCLDIVSKLLYRGFHINIIEYGNNIMSFQLNQEAAEPYQKAVIDDGASLYTNAIVVSAGMIGDEITSLTLNNGEKINTDMVIVSSGISPNSDFLEGSDIRRDCGLVEIKGQKLRKGVLVNKKCETNIPDIYAAGDVCAEKLPLWPIAVKQGIVAAYNMALKDKEMRSVYGLKNPISYFGINTISIGDPNVSGPNIETIDYRDDLHGVYKHALVENGKYIRSIILQGEIQGAGIFERLIEDEMDISGVNKYLFDFTFDDFFELDDRGQIIYSNKNAI